MTEIGPDVPEFTMTVPGRDAPLRLRWAALTDTGRRRSHNEDSFIAQAPVFAVADGMGGHSSGDLASDAVVSRLAEIADGGFADVEGVENALQRASEDIDRVTDPESSGVGTTVTGAAVIMHGLDASILVFNIGDSRTYLLEDAQLHQVTVDHSVVQELVDAGLISDEDAEHHPDSNVITRAVGFGAPPQPDCWTVPLRAGQRLLVCSDGLTKELRSDRIRGLLVTHHDPADAARELVDAALDAGGRDNVTVVIVDVLEAPPALAAETGADRSSR